MHQLGGANHRGNVANRGTNHRGTAAYETQVSGVLTPPELTTHRRLRVVCRGGQTWLFEVVSGEPGGHEW